MNTVERLRPEIRPLDAEWSATTIEGIFASEPKPGPSKARRPRRLVLVGATAAGLFAVGGVSYAGGLIPSSVTEDLGWVSSSKVSGVHEVASFAIETDGRSRSLTIWRGTSSDGLSCTAVLEEKGKFGPEFGGNCGDYPTDAWFDTTSESYRMGETPPSPTYFVYGEPTLPGVTSVRVVGDDFTHTVAVDPTTGGYALAIPEIERGVSGRFATVEFVDADGNVVGTRDLSEK